MPTTKEAQKICFQRGLSAGSVNSKGFADVSIITGGVEALGHGLFVDEGSISGLMGLLMGKTLPGYLTHDGAMFGDRLTNEIGLFSGFYRDGLKVKAAQFSFLNSFIKHSAGAYETLMELADKVPDQFGLSVVFSGEAVWACEDGSEVSAELAKPDNCNAEYPSIRFSSVESADFVKSPAANPAGLLARIDERAESMADTISLSKHSEALEAAKLEVTSALSATHKAALDKLAADHVAALAAKDEAHKTVTAALAEKEVELLAAKTAHESALSAKDIELKDAQKFDIRLSGAAEAVSIAAQLGGATGSVLPTPVESDSGKWTQFYELHEKDPKQAEAFRAKYIANANRAARK